MRKIRELPLRHNVRNLSAAAVGDLAAVSA
jgi:hypothetical protein